MKAKDSQTQNKTLDFSGLNYRIDGVSTDSCLPVFLIVFVPMVIGIVSELI